MSQRKWLLVEWASNQDVFPTYGVVKSDYVIEDGSQIRVGNFVLVRSKYGRPGCNGVRAQILKISEDKNSVKEQKLLLERQDNQVKNVLALCMRTLSEVKSESVYGSPLSPMNRTVSAFSQHNGVGSVETDSENEMLINEPIHTVLNRPSSRMPGYSNNIQSNGHQSRHSDNYGNSDRNQQAIQGCSQALRPKTVIYREKQTQTCDELLEPSAEHIHQYSVEKIAAMEATIEELHKTYQSLLIRININRSREEENGSNETEKSDLEEDVNKAVEQNTMTPEPENEVPRTGLQVEPISGLTRNDMDQSNGNELIPIGAGYAKVPVRLLREIDWTSHTHATRVLLQAIFPRKILATHSLTGKQSPAFLDKPPKKRLDPRLVNDVVELVSERCGVAPRLVRNSITIKCTDECKLYRNRLEFKKKRLADQENQENHPPASSLHDEPLNGST